ncbi:MAG: Rpn family recombination-promoting nuclease/putative transposase [Pantoea sp.]|nr:Rpn family recombination-promoting nuclease/putative transposase [Pantoea septica]MBU5379871.1 Rpn family recombination-promoting nuclease/putative transposase [Pantoea septica]MDU5838292.1 Rpn family recombination-promoting nuclease/putative transposase [Pantoea sp.]
MKQAHTPTPHDAVFKTVLSNLQTARDVMTSHLPPALLAAKAYSPARA